MHGYWQLDGNIYSIFSSNSKDKANLNIWTWNKEDVINSLATDSKKWKYKTDKTSLDSVPEKNIL